MGKVNQRSGEEVLGKETEKSSGINQINPRAKLSRGIAPSTNLIDGEAMKTLSDLLGVPT
ncbi:OLC1v1035898C1, partial [Oldenlandia corymbosa var. corymbosa]